MKNVMLLCFVAFLLGFTLTGFQCGSAEMTSARMYIQRSEWGNAERSLEQEVVKNPNNVEAWYLLGRARLELKNYRGMDEAFGRSLAIGNQHEKDIKIIRLVAWGQLFTDGVETYLKGKRVEGDSSRMLMSNAVEKFKIALTLNPDSAATYTNLGLAYLGLDDFDNALMNFETALQKEKDPDLALSIANMYFERARKSQTGTKDGTAGKSDLDKALLTIEKGEEYARHRLDQINAAIEKISTGGREPLSEEYRKLLDELEMRKAETEKVLSNLTATKLDIYATTGRTEEALKNLKLALEKNPNNKFFRYNYGVLLLKAGKHREAVDQFEAAVVADQKFEDAMYNLGVSYLQWGAKRRSEAEAASRASKEKKVDRSYEEQFRGAKVTLEHLRDLRPNDPDVWEALGQAYANLNMQKQASDSFNKADELRKKK